MRTGELILKQSKKILDNKHYAIACAVVLAMLPFAAWVSVALVALVTLRKGAKCGSEVLIPAMVIHSVPLILLVPIESALINTLVSYIPCFLGAITLRHSQNWQTVFGVFLALATSSFLLLHFCFPQYAEIQLTQFKKILSHYQEYQTYWEQNVQGISSSNSAQLFLGIQILSVLISAISSLLCARFIQAKLFMPGGLKEELLLFRAGRGAFLLLVMTSMAAYYEYAVAINLLPIVLSYFLLAGFNLSYFILGTKKHTKIGILLFLLIIVKPALMLSACILLGSLDSLFNFRLYLPERVRESI